MTLWRCARLAHVILSFSSFAERARATRLRCGWPCYAVTLLSAKNRLTEPARGIQWHERAIARWLRSSARAQCGLRQRGTSSSSQSSNAQRGAPRCEYLSLPAATESPTSPGSDDARNLSGPDLRELQSCTGCGEGSCSVNRRDWGTITPSRSPSAGLAIVLRVREGSELLAPRCP